MIKMIRKGLMIVLVCIIFVFPLITRQFFLVHLGIMIFMWATLGIAWNFLGGYAGQVSLGNAIFFGIGAYTPTLLMLKAEIIPFAGLIVAILIASGFALMIGWPLFRLNGHYFSIATLCLGELMLICFTNWRWAGDARGLLLPIKGTSLLYLQFSSKTGYYYLCLIILLLTLAVSKFIIETRPGYYFRAIKNDPEAAFALGINITRYKVIAFMLSAIFTSMAGSFYANYVLYIDPDSTMLLQISVMMALVTILGGVGRLWGPVLGATVLVPISELSRIYFSGGGRAIDIILYGVLIIIFAVFKPRGLLSLLDGFVSKEENTDNYSTRRMSLIDTLIDKFDVLIHKRGGMKVE